MVRTRGTCRVRWTRGDVRLVATEVGRAADFYVRMFGAVLMYGGLMSRAPQAWLDLNGRLSIIRGRWATDDLVEEVNTRIDHFGVRVDDLDRAAADLKAKGVTKVAFIEGPDGIRIELLERSGRAGSATATAPRASETRFGPRPTDPQ